MCRVQNRIFGEIDQNCETVTLAAAEDDQIGFGFLGRAQDLRLGVAGRHFAGRALEAEALRQIGESFLAAFNQVLLDLRRRHQGLAHRVHRDELDDMQCEDFGIGVAGNALAGAGNLFAAVRQVQQELYFFVACHRF